MDKADQLQQGWNEEHNCVVITITPEHFSPLSRSAITSRDSMRRKRSSSCANTVQRSQRPSLVMIGMHQFVSATKRTSSRPLRKLERN